MSNPIALPSRPSDRSPAILAIGVWLVTALAVALAEPITLERRAAIPITMASLVVSQIVLYRRGGAFRALADSIDTKWLVLFHSLRAPIGAAFLLLIAHGLDATFARVAGIGDIVSGTLAIGVGLFASRVRSVVLAWNLLALADIVLVIVTAQRILIFSDHPQTMQVLVHFPGMLLVTFLVPLVVTVHLLILARLRHAARPGTA